MQSQASKVPSFPRPIETDTMPVLGNAEHSPTELAALRRAARLAAQALRAAKDLCAPGVTTGEIDSHVRVLLRDAGATPLFEGYRQRDSPPYPAATCISINDEVVHGVPGPRPLRPGDLVSIDLGIRLDGWCADVATSIVIEPDTPGIAGALIAATRDTLRHAVQLIQPGRAWSSIALELERRAAAAGLGIVTEYVGHGIGRELHEPPKVPTYRTGFTGEDFLLTPGMVLTIEPLLCSPRSGPYPKAAGEAPFIRTPVRLSPNGWTVTTADASFAAHEEHMILVTVSGAEILSAPNGAESP
jgi:methionyl aminopeptidase